jgi:xanthine dehydrogenase accessory factor
MFGHITVWVRGAGETATAAARCLHRVGFGVLASDLPAPLAIRRTVSFSDAIFTGASEVEGVRAQRCDIDAAPDIISQGLVPVVLDAPEQILELGPQVMVDARMLKSYSENILAYAPFTAGLGPGFDAGRNCHVVIETKRGHDLGRIIWRGAAHPDTKVPGNVGGQSLRRVIYAQENGAVKWRVDFGDLVDKNDLLGTINAAHEIPSPIAGLVRGLISPQVHLVKGLKIADIDPRGKVVNHKTISDKARAVGRGVLEAILIHLSNEHEAPRMPMTTEK